MHRQMKSAQLSQIDSTGCKMSCKTNDVLNDMSCIALSHTAAVQG